MHQTYYYTEEIHLREESGTLYGLEGTKTIEIYDIDTQYVNIISVHSMYAQVSEDSEANIQEWFKEINPETELTLVRL